MSESNITLHSNTGVGTLDLPANAPRETESFGKLSAPRFASGSAILQRIFSFPAMLASLLVGAVFYLGREFIVDPDLWWHIKVGDTILTTHRWPTTDPYSFTVSGQPWIAHEWLGDVIWAAAYRVGDLKALDFLLIVLGSAIVLSIYALATLCSGKSKAGFASSTLLLLLTLASFSLRPQMLGYLFFVLTLIALESFRQGKSWAIWFVPVLTLLWVNVHASWIMGPLTVLVYWISGLLEFRSGSLEAKHWSSEQREKISFAFLLSVAMIPVNPYGVRMATVPFELALTTPLSTKYIAEYQGMPFNMAIGKVFLVFLLGFILMQVVTRYEWRLEELALVLLGTMMACLHVRFVLVFVPFFAPVLAKVLARWLPAYDQAKDKFALNAVLMACVVAAMVHYFPSRAELRGSVARHFPVAAVEFLQSHSIPDPMFNSWDFGGYLLWSRGTTHKVFFDGRSEVYEHGGVFNDYIHITRLRPGALAVLDGYGIRSCLVTPSEPLATMLAESPGWQRVYRDSVSALFVRTASGAEVVKTP